ncbi:MAG: polysaccharide biosynthesis C-terminal domain-containing protein [Candidatus Omnitrophica bacterium]|nr:polysaccharide biosynthesis C-terminal domain-containing protein [Candidatus Omnitrophota bacterium]
MSNLNIIAKGSTLSFIGSAISYLFLYLFILIASNILGANILGAYFWAASIINIVAEASRLGLVQGLLYFVPKMESEKQKNSSLQLLNFALKSTFWITLAASIIFFIFADKIAIYLNKSDYGTLIRVMSVSMPFALFWPIIYRYLSARFQIKAAVLYGDILRSILRVVLLLIMLLLGFKFYALPFTDIILSFCLFIIGIFILNNIYGYNMFGRAKHNVNKRELLMYSAPFIPLSLIRENRVIIIILGFFLGMTKIGIFSVALKLAVIPSFILITINFVFRPMITKLLTENNHSELRSIYKSITRWIFICALPFSYILIFYPSSVLSLFGNKFIPGAMVLSIITLGYLFDYGTSLTQQIITMSGKSWLTLMNQLIGFLCMASLAVVFIPHYDIVGAAIAISVGIIAVNIIRLIQSYKIIGCTPYSLYLLKPITACLLTGLAMAFFFHIGMQLSFIKLLLLIALYFILYGLTIIILGLNKEDMLLLQAARERILKKSTWSFGLRM